MIIWKYIFTLLVLVTYSCRSQESDLIFITRLPKLISETSGLETLSMSDGFWTLNDAGNTNEIFLFDTKGKIKEIVEITNAKNIDWEALASNGIDELYIGDFGNNKNVRSDLTIYHVKVDHIKNNKVSASKTTFTYEDQKKFPPKKKDRNFDAEAFIFYKGYFYIFSKNRSSQFDGKTKLYKIPAIEGKFIAKLIGEFKTCSDAKDCLITGADISEDGKSLALLTKNKVFLFSNYKGDDFFNGKNQKIKFSYNSQKEAISIVGNLLYITDERNKNSGGNLYKFIIEK